MLDARPLSIRTKEGVTDALPALLKIRTLFRMIKGFIALLAVCAVLNSPAIGWKRLVEPIGRAIERHTLPVASSRVQGMDASQDIVPDLQLPQPTSAPVAEVAPVKS